MTDFVTQPIYRSHVHGTPGSLPPIHPRMGARFSPRRSIASGGLAQNRSLGSVFQPHTLTPLSQSSVWPISSQTGQPSESSGSIDPGDESQANPFHCQTDHRLDNRLEQWAQWRLAEPSLQQSSRNSSPLPFSEAKPQVLPREKEMEEGLEYSRENPGLSHHGDAFPHQPSTEMGASSPRRPGQPDGVPNASAIHDQSLETGDGAYPHGHLPTRETNHPTHLSALFGSQSGTALSKDSDRPPHLSSSPHPPFYSEDITASAPTTGQSPLPSLESSQNAIHADVIDQSGDSLSMSGSDPGSVPVPDPGPGPNPAQHGSLFPPPPRFPSSSEWDPAEAKTEPETKQNAHSFLGVSPVHRSDNPSLFGGSPPHSESSTFPPQSPHPPMHSATHYRASLDQPFDGEPPSARAIAKLLGERSPQRDHFDQWPEPEPELWNRQALRNSQLPPRPDPQIGQHPVDIESAQKTLNQRHPQQKYPNRIRPAQVPPATDINRLESTQFDGRRGMTPPPDIQPTIEISIGRIEVRTTSNSQPSKARKRSQSSGPKLSLSEYLQQRNGAL